MAFPHEERHRLEQADEIISRLGATYTEAKEALDSAEGDTLGALALVEQKRAAAEEDYAGLAARIAKAAVEAATSECVTAVRFKLGRSLLRELPVTMTGVLAAAIVCGAMLVTHCTVEVERTKPEMT
jgi:hypothetical protein